jgi:ATP-dependent protease ClpP protease subunit
MRILATAILTLTALAMPAQTYAAIIEVVDDEIRLRGPVVEGDARRFANAVIQFGDVPIHWNNIISLNSPGGDVWETLQIAEMVRWIEVAITYVTRDSKCLSACFGLFAAGYQKIVDPIGDPTQIGVHSVSVVDAKTGEIIGEGGNTTIRMARLLVMLGVPDTVISKIVLTPPENMSYLTVDELLAMHVLVTGRPQNAPHPPQRKYSVAGEGRDFGVMSSWMIPAMTIRDVGLDNNRILPSGSVVLVDVGPVGSERKNCFLERDYVCHIQFRIPGEKIEAAVVWERDLWIVHYGFYSFLHDNFKRPGYPNNPADQP